MAQVAATPAEDRKHPPESSSEDAAATTTTPTSPRGSRTRVELLTVVGALFLVIFLSALDTTIVTTALPTIARELTFSDADFTWVGSAYTLASSASTPPWGKLSDIFGRKPVLLCANGVLLIGSLLCALSVNASMLIAGRVIQGLGGGGISTLVYICIADLMDIRNRGLVYGVLGFATGIAVTIGPLLGGIFAESVTWRWCFYINLPCDGAALLILFFFLKIDTAKRPLIEGLRAIDWLGTFLIVAGVVMFLFGLETGGVGMPWNSAAVVCLLVLGSILIVLFFVSQWKFSRSPTIPTRLFEDRRGLAAFGICFSHAMALMTSSYYLPFYFQAVQLYTPFHSGIAILPFFTGIGITSSMVAVYIRKTGRFVLPNWAGMALLTLGFGLFIDLPVTQDWRRIAPFEVIAGLGIGPILQAPLIALQSYARPEELATATASFGFVRQIAAAIGLVLGGVIFQNQVAAARLDLATILNAADTDALTTRAYSSGIAIIARLPPSAQLAVQTIYARSLSAMWIFVTAIAGLGLVLCFFLLPRKSGVDDIQESELKSNHARSPE